MSTVAPTFAAIGRACVLEDRARTVVRDIEHDVLMGKTGPDTATEPRAALAEAAAVLRILLDTYYRLSPEARHADAPIETESPA